MRKRTSCGGRAIRSFPFHSLLHRRSNRLLMLLGIRTAKEKMLEGEEEKGEGEGEAVRGRENKTQVVRCGIHIYKYQGLGEIAIHGYNDIYSAHLTAFFSAHL